MVVLVKKKLKYYAVDQPNIPEGCIDFDQTPCMIKIEDVSNPRTLILEEIDNAKAHMFKASTPKECQEWFTLITQHLNVSKGFKQKLLPIAFEKHFWKSNRLSISKFKDICDTGDLLLF